MIFRQYFHETFKVYDMYVPWIYTLQIFYYIVKKSGENDCLAVMIEKCVKNYMGSVRV